MSLNDALWMYELARHEQLAAEEAGDLIRALQAQRTASMWWAIVQRKYTAAAA